MCQCKPFCQMEMHTASSRIATITTEDLSRSDRLANNVTGTGAIYKSYKEKLMEPSGTIVWRLFSDKHEQVILNDIKCKLHIYQRRR